MCGNMYTGKGIKLFLWEDNRLFHVFCFNDNIRIGWGVDGLLVFLRTEKFCVKDETVGGLVEVIDSDVVPIAFLFTVASDNI